MRTFKYRTAATAALASVLTLSVAACGSQLSEQRLAAGAGGYGTQAADTAPAGGVGQPAVPAAPVGGNPAAGAGTPVTGAAAGSTAPALGGAAGTTGTGGTGAINKPAKGAPATQSTIGQGAACSAPLAPIRLGQTLVSSGLVGAVLANLRAGLALWVADVNSRGGVQCHPIELYAMDDGSDPARVQQNFNTLVNDKKVVAMVGVGTPVADTAAKDSAERLKIPVVGGDVTSPIWYNSPYIFPQGAAIVAGFTGGLREGALSHGGKRGGLLYCVEATNCSSANSDWGAIAKNAGVATGLSKAVSITSPDYTAECQAMKDDGVDTMFVSVDGSAATRIARSCAALNYFPVLAAPGVAINPQVAADQVIRKFTLFQGVANAPFPATDNNGVREFTAAVKRLAPGAALDQPYLQGWLSGKLFEAVLRNVSTEARQGPVTTELVLKGLGLVKNETLDGTAAPLTFTLGKPAPRVDCYFTLKIDVKGVTAPRGSQKHCF